MVIEGHFKQVGIKPVWYVDADSLADYKKLGLNAKVGGKLTPARNMALDDAKAKKLVCVQVSDDISKWTYYDIEKQDLRGEQDFKKANATLAGTRRHVVSPSAAAQYILAKMRADPEKPRLGGVFPTANAAMTLGTEEYGRQHFILGDFFVAEPVSPCRFDTTMTLKEDYDYTCSHIAAHGSVLRCNRMFIQVKHSTNVGGAVATRDSAGAKEKQNIAILQTKWPGVFSLNGRRKAADSEVVMCWKRHSGGDGKEGECDAAGKQVKNVPVNATKLKVKKDSGAKAARCGFDGASVLKRTEKESSTEYLAERCRRCNGRTVSQVVGMTYKDASGKDRTYRGTDLKYDIARGPLEIRGKSRGA